METRVEVKEGQPVVTDGANSLPVPPGYRLLRDYEAKQAELDHDTLFEMLLAFHELRDLDIAQVNEIVDRTLNIYDERQRQVEDMQGLQAFSGLG
jgi:hypothetical protein